MFTYLKARRCVQSHSICIGYGGGVVHYCDGISVYVCGGLFNEFGDIQTNRLYTIRRGDDGIYILQ